MKKGAGIVIVVCAVLFVSLFSASLVSASWFGDFTGWWHDLFFGKPEPMLSPGEFCFDSDEGMDYSIKGTTTFGGESLVDFCNKGGPVGECSGPDCYLNEYYCASNSKIGQRTDVRCQYGCRDGTCAKLGSCVSKCGDGICQEEVCLELGCPCAETKTNCPRDCAVRNATTGAVREIVNCVFADSSLRHRCYSPDNRFGCSGNGSCSASVSGSNGEKVQWASSCGGAVSTTIDGVNEYAKFDCSVGLAVTEQVKCFFSAYDPSTEPRCYTLDRRFGCTAYNVGSCIMNVTGIRGRTMTWSSPCSDETFTTTVDGTNHYIAFRCTTPFMSPQ